MGEAVTWIVPHPFTYGIPYNVDFRVMLTFIDFYEVFLKFVLFKLYALSGMAYPPTAAALGLVTKPTHSQVATLPTKETLQLEAQFEQFAGADDDEELGESGGVGLQDQLSPVLQACLTVEVDDSDDLLRSKFPQLIHKDQDHGGLFRNCIVFVSREAPLDWIRICVCSLG